MISIDLERGLATVDDGRSGRTTFPLSSPEAFAVIARAWLRAGWDAKYVYSFSWLGRPVIQLPEDLIRVQEAIYQVKPTVIIETGVAHGGFLVFCAGLLKAMGGGRVIGIDIEIRPHNRRAIEAHELFDQITLIEGDSASPKVVMAVRSLLQPTDRVFVVLDSDHSKQHVLDELNAYADMVSVSSYLVAADGIMRDLIGAPRTRADWAWNNPRSAVEEFLRANSDFELSEPPFPFNQGGPDVRVTYWQGGWLKRKR